MPSESSKKDGPYKRERTGSSEDEFSYESNKDETSSGEEDLSSVSNKKYLPYKRERTGSSEGDLSSESSKGDASSYESKEEAESSNKQDSSTSG